MIYLKHFQILLVGFLKKIDWLFFSNPMLLESLELQYSIDSWSVSFWRVAQKQELRVSFNPTEKLWC